MNNSSCVTWQVMFLTCSTIARPAPIVVGVKNSVYFKTVLGSVLHQFLHLALLHWFSSAICQIPLGLTAACPFQHSVFGGRTLKAFLSHHCNFLLGCIFTNLCENLVLSVLQTQLLTCNSKHLCLCRWLVLAGVFFFCQMNWYFSNISANFVNSPCVSAFNHCCVGFVAPSTKMSYFSDSNSV